MRCSRESAFPAIRRSEPLLEGCAEHLADVGAVFRKEEGLDDFEFHQEKLAGLGAKVWREREK